MKTVVGKILTVEIGVPIKKRDGGTYDGWRINYQKEDGSVEVLAKATANFKYQPSLKASVESLAPGDMFTVELEKNDKGFLDVVSISKGAKMPVETPKKEYKTDKSGNWETTEERAARQIYIVRQSSIANAIAALGPGKKTADYIKTAKDFEDHIFSKGNAESAPEVE